MKRKLLLLAGVLILTAWASAANALGTCSCTFCFPGSRAHCMVGTDIWACGDYRLNFC
jgi:hypothetical protein